MEQTAVNAFFTGRAVYLLDYNMYKLAESQDFTRGVVRHLIKYSTFTVPVTRFVKQQAEQAVASEAKFRQNRSPGIPV